MFVLVHHTVQEPERFWAAAESAIPNIPATMKLHHTLSARDGTLATCLWEADSVNAIRDFLEPVLGAVSSNEYREAENRDGIALPTKIAAAPAARR